MTAGITAAVDALCHAAYLGTIQLDGTGPASPAAQRARETGLEPHFGVVTWTLPPSYRGLLAGYDRLACRLVDPDGFESAFVVVDHKEIVRLNADLVHLPEGVSRGGGPRLSTNHLVGFAEAGHEAVWCFDVSRPDTDGEYPVYYHHVDEPRVRYLDDGEWEDPADIEPDFVSFTAWLAAMATAFTAAEPPEWVADLGSPGLVGWARHGGFRRASA